MSMYSIRQGQREFGATSSSDIIIYDTLLDSKSLWLTANTSTMYAMGWLDLKTDGPTVIDLPPRMLGILDDMAFLYLTDLGMAGPDKGQGGKFLVLPPDHDGDVPDGYFVVRSKTYGVWLFMRGYLDKGVEAASNNIRNNLRVYPLASKNNPPPTTFHNGSGREIQTVLPNDYRFYENLNAVVQEEPEDFLGPEIKGQLAAIGIVKGQPFTPDARMGKRSSMMPPPSGTRLRVPSASPPRSWGCTLRPRQRLLQADQRRRHGPTRHGARSLEGRVFYHFGYILRVRRPWPPRSRARARTTPWAWSTRTRGHSMAPRRTA